MMRTSRQGLLGLVMALGCGARTDLPCGTVDGALDYQCEGCGEAQDESPSCEGTGRIWISSDDCIDDGGGSDSGDLLEVYCDGGLARFCLSHEECPWRNGGSAGDDVSCSRAGLHSTYMARMIHGCEGWEGHDRYCCSPEGRIGFAAR